MLQLSFYNFFMKKCHSCTRKKTVSVEKTCYMAKPFGHSKIYDTKRFKKIKKKSEISSHW